MQNLERRSFLKSAVACPLAGFQRALDGFPQALSLTEQGAQFVAAGADRLGEPHKGPRAQSHLDFKIVTQDTNGGLFLLEHTNMTRGGPPRHLHYEQEEWFYLIEGGEVLMEIGHEKLRLKPGDCVLAPRKVPHAWAYAGENPGRMILAFTPAGKMEAFFIATSKPGNHLGDAQLMREHGMELIGPPLLT
jgi:mannose-6-phosphate isomerase-like protein (cupin superfamily)